MDVPPLIHLYLYFFQLEAITDTVAIIIWVDACFHFSWVNEYPGVELWDRSESESHSVVSSSLRPHGLYSTWNSPGQNIGVGCHFFLQGIFLTPGTGLTCPALPDRFFATEAPGKTQIYSNQLVICPETIKESYKGKEEMFLR